MMNASTAVTKTVVVTGATSGIGLAAARAFAGQGLRVIGVGRDGERCRLAMEKIKSAYPEAQVQYLVADFSHLAQVRQLASDINATLSAWDVPRLDILVNNAGLYSDHYVETEDDLELTQAVNHFAPFLLTHILLPLLKKAPFGRVVTVSSASHYNTWINVARLNTPRVYLGIWAYKVSKLANVLFTLEFNRRMGTTQVRAFAVDPGLVNTDIGAKGTGKFTSSFWRNRQQLGVQPEVPAKTIVFLSLEQSLQGSSDYFWYDLHPKIASAQANNAQIAKALWEQSCRLCDISEFGEETA